MAIEGPSLRYARGGMSPRLSRARALAREIEDLLTGLSPDEIAPFAYQVRLAQGLTNSLLDQLEELERRPSERNIPASPASGVATAPESAETLQARSLLGR